MSLAAMSAIGSRKHQCEQRGEGHPAVHAPHFSPLSLGQEWPAQSAPPSRTSRHPHYIGPIFQATAHKKPAIGGDVFQTVSEQSGRRVCGLCYAAAPGAFPNRVATSQHCG
jgi:hypothetical protein